MFTFEKQDRVRDTFSLWTLHSGVQVSGDTWEVLLDVFWISLLQSLVKVAEHFIIL